MNRNYDNSRTNDIPPEQLYSLRMVLHDYAQVSKALGPDCNSVIFAHQILFPRSSATGMNIITTKVRAIHGNVPFHNTPRYYDSIRKKITQELIRNGHGFALLLAGTLEHNSRERYIHVPAIKEDKSLRLRRAMLESDFFQQEL